MKFSQHTTGVPGSAENEDYFGSAIAAKSYSQDTSGITGTPETEDQFGAYLKLTDYTRDGRADLMIDTNEQLGYEDRWGLVHQLKG